MLISSFQTSNTCREAIAVGAIILGHQIRGDLTNVNRGTGCSCAKTRALKKFSQIARGAIESWLPTGPEKMKGRPVTKIESSKTVSDQTT